MRELQGFGVYGREDGSLYASVAGAAFRTEHVRFRIAPLQVCIEKAAPCRREPPCCGAPEDSGALGGERVQPAFGLDHRDEGAATELPGDQPARLHLSVSRCAPDPRPSAKVVNRECARRRLAVRLAVHRSALPLSC